MKTKEKQRHQDDVWLAVLPWIDLVRPEPRALVARVLAATKAEAKKQLEAMYKSPDALADLLTGPGVDVCSVLIGKYSLIRLDAVQVLEPAPLAPNKAPPRTMKEV